MQCINQRYLLLLGNCALLLNGNPRRCKRGSDKFSGVYRINFFRKDAEKMKKCISRTSPPPSFASQNPPPPSVGGKESALFPNPLAPLVRGAVERMRD